MSSRFRKLAQRLEGQPDPAEAFAAKVLESVEREVTTRTRELQREHAALVTRHEALRVRVAAFTRRDLDLVAGAGLTETAGKLEDLLTEAP